VLVTWDNNRVITLNNVDPSDTVDTLKQMIQDMECMPRDQQLLFNPYTNQGFNPSTNNSSGAEFNPSGATLADLRIQNRANICLARQPTILIQLQSDDNRLHSFRITRTVPMKQVVESYIERYCVPAVPAWDLELMVGPHAIDDDLTANSPRLRDQAVLRISMRPEAGRVMVQVRVSSAAIDPSRFSVSQSILSTEYRY
jgi:hypothetical protein